MNVSLRHYTIAFPFTKIDFASNSFHQIKFHTERGHSIRDNTKGHNLISVYLSVSKQNTIILSVANIYTHFSLHSYILLSIMQKYPSVSNTFLCLYLSHHTHTHSLSLVEMLCQYHYCANWLHSRTVYTFSIKL